MHESIYRQQQHVKRMFGASATLNGEFGTDRRPGHLRILVDGREIGTGGNFQEAIQAASRHLAKGTRTCPEISAKS